MSLQSTSQNFKKGLRIFIFVFIFYNVATLFLIPQGKKLLLSFAPPKDPATPIYGVLDPLIFSQKTVTETVTSVAGAVTNAAMDFVGNLFNKTPTSNDTGEGKIVPRPIIVIQQPGATVSTYSDAQFQAALNSAVSDGTSPVSKEFLKYVDTNFEKISDADIKANTVFVAS